ncbi:DNA-binding protein [Thalassolituus sp. LLYu03]|uniref:DNA-binding protein n=1 Tax=Thalassolituus sp. LLYu03 TaxID=3421656 RepID=UPI003D2D8D64
MARLGITFEDVSAAAQAVRTAGQEPTVDRVRELLGTGSKSTIAPLLKRWRQEFTGEQKIEGLPAELIQAVKAVYEQLENSAQEKIRVARQQFAEAEAQLQASLQAEQERSSALLAAKKDSDERLHLAQEQCLTLAEQLDVSRREGQQVQMACAQAQSQVTELKVVQGELRQELRASREHLEHYQQRIAIERQQERDDFRTQLNQQQQRLQQADVHQQQLLAAGEQLRRELSELQQGRVRDEAAMARDQELLQVLRDQLAQAQTQNDSLSQQLQQQRDAVQRQGEVVQQQQLTISSLEQQGIHSKQDAQTLRQALAQAEQEVRALLADKADVQGQLRVLQQLHQAGQAPA